MTRIEEIAERLDAHQTERKASHVDELGIHWRDIAYLLEEVKRLERVVGQFETADRQRLYLIDACNEAEAIARSLAEALHVAQKALAMVIDPDSIKATTVSGAFAAATEAERGARSALSDQRLLKLKGAA